MTITDTSYKRARSTKVEVEHRRTALYSIVRAMRPMTVRQSSTRRPFAEIIEKVRGRLQQGPD